MCKHKKPTIESIGTNKCNQMWHYSLIKQILINSNEEDVKEDEDDFDILKLELLSSRNRLECKELNVQKCHYCNTVHFKHSAHKTSIKSMNGYKVLKSKCVCCKRLFCWNCGKKYKKGHVCESSHVLEI